LIVRQLFTSGRVFLHTQSHRTCSFCIYHPQVPSKVCSQLQSETSCGGSQGLCTSSIPPGCTRRCGSLKARLPAGASSGASGCPARSPRRCLCCNACCGNPGAGAGSLLGGPGEALAAPQMDDSARGTGEAPHRGAGSRGDHARGASPINPARRQEPRRL